jgi:hypothetical protein
VKSGNSNAAAGSAARLPRVLNMFVARVVRPPQVRVVLDADEPGGASAVGGVGAATRVPGADDECVDAAASSAPAGHPAASCTSSGITRAGSGARPLAETGPALRATTIVTPEAEAEAGRQLVGH